MSSLTHFDIQKVEREYEKLRIHLAAELCRLNAVLPFALMLRRNEIDHIARDLVEAVRRAPYRRKGPLLVRWVGAIRAKASHAVHRSEPEVQGSHGRLSNTRKDRREPKQDEQDQVFGDVPNIPFALPQLWAEADKVRAANSNRPRP